MLGGSSADTGKTGFRGGSRPAAAGKYAGVDLKSIDTSKIDEMTAATFDRLKAMKK